MSVQNGMQSGFSLVEVIMTVFILAMAASLIVVTFPQNPPPVVREAKRFGAVLELAVKQSRVGGLPLGLVVSDTAYSIVVWRDKKWNTLSGAVYQIRDGISLNSTSPAVPGRPDNWPVVIFDPLGAPAPSEFEVSESGDRVFVRLQTDGSVGLSEQDD